MVIQKIRFLCINGLVALVLAAFLETILWVGLNYPQFIPSVLLHPYREMYQRQDRSIIQVSPCAQYDSGLFYTLKPGQSVFENREFSVVNKVNSEGLRDDERSLAHPDILVLGDSYAMGWGVSQEETFPQVLERLTDQNVLNAGISSFGTAREMKLLRRIDTSNLKHLIIQYHPNDYEENITYMENGYDLPIRSQKQYDSLKNAIRRRAEYFPFKYLTGISSGIAKTILRPTPRDTANTLAEARMFLDILERSLPAKDSLRILVFKTEVLSKLQSDRFIRSLDSLVNKEPYPWYNITVFSIADFLTEDDYFILDDHINASGHNKIARKLFEFIHNESPTVGTKILVKQPKP